MGFISREGDLHTAQKYLFSSWLTQGIFYSVYLCGSIRMLMPDVTLCDWYGGIVLAIIHLCTHNVM